MLRFSFGVFASRFLDRFIGWNHHDFTFLSVCILLLKCATFASWKIWNHIALSLATDVCLCASCLLLVEQIDLLLGIGVVSMCLRFVILRVCYCGRSLSLHRLIRHWRPIFCLFSSFNLPSRLACAVSLRSVPALILTWFWALSLTLCSITKRYLRMKSISYISLCSIQSICFGDKRCFSFLCTGCLYICKCICLEKFFLLLRLFAELIVFIRRYFELRRWCFLAHLVHSRSCVLKEIRARCGRCRGLQVITWEYVVACCDLAFEVRVDYLAELKLFTFLFDLLQRQKWCRWFRIVFLACLGDQAMSCYAQREKLLYGRRVLYLWCQKLSVLKFAKKIDVGFFCGFGELLIKMIYVRHSNFDLI